ncbi:hypothetical protein GOP47_0004336 [Adiantum capillus-veneris]|uniref:Uncharacterized protein n=1 Tax=Adiantum capillus-veneris TaxID=13818 RepID=A0A9D4V8N5_ADICA|nr:hypothetical protein GOP47_0004336 [Adiantum capillus-veneris]
MKGKSKLEGPSKRQRVTDTTNPITEAENTTQPSIVATKPGYVEVGALNQIFYPLVLHHLQDHHVFHLQAPQLGEGKWAYEKQVHLLHLAFSDLHFADKGVYCGITN